MDKFEKLKSATIQYSLLDLLKNRLSDFIVDEIIQIDSLYQNEKIISKEITSREDIVELQNFLELNKEKLYINNLYSYCIEELKEIKSDFRWRNSKDGKLIIKIEEWIDMMRVELELRFKESKLFVGRSFVEPKELIVGGVVKNNIELDCIKNFIEIKNPPVLPKYNFEIEECL